MVLVFPGQGSQFVGMGKELYDNFDIAKEIYKKAANLIGKEFIDLSFEGSMQEISLTQNSQPIIFLYSYVLAMILESKNRINFSNIKYTAGHSLGEITSLVFANLINFEEGIKFVRFRGEVMSNSFSGNGGMYALLFPEVEEIEKVLSESFEGKVYVANFNSYAQVVISGLMDDMKNFVEENKNNLFKKAILLKVSQPFHTPFMNEAYKKIKKYLENIEFETPRFKIYSNYKADLYNFDKKDIVDNISKQVVSTVRWIEIIKNLSSKGENSYIEIGPKAVLGSFIKNIEKEAICDSFTKI